MTVYFYFIFNLNLLGTHMGVSTYKESSGAVAFPSLLFPPPPPCSHNLPAGTNLPSPLPTAATTILLPPRLVLRPPFHPQASQSPPRRYPLACVSSIRTRPLSLE